ncbi:hypothetical protein [Pedobacter sp. Leaf170]|uniref:hypothetical protein n=1 Tax=Pedobacter sp. Leaf170 TaxID=2876558 RepID=UPI001E53A6C2|nr:hypothetical protein [Pedobacter sp. Leaf170]
MPALQFNDEISSLKTIYTVEGRLDKRINQKDAASGQTLKLSQLRSQKLPM